MQIGSLMRSFFIYFFSVSILFYSCSTSTDGDEGEIDDTITFTEHVRPLVLEKCQPCHIDGGSQPNWSVYATAKASAADIVSRTASGSMPRNGANGGLTQTQKDIFSKWVADGLLE